MTTVTPKISRGDNSPMQWTNGTGVAVVSKQLLIIGGIAAVAVADIGIGETGVVWTEGVFEIAKNTHATTKAFVAGEHVVHDSANSRTDKRDTVAGVFIGCTYKSAASTDTTQFVDLNKQPRRYAVNRTVSGGEATANTNGRVDFDTGLGVAPGWFTAQVYSSAGVLKAHASLISSVSPGSLRIDGGASAAFAANDVVRFAYEA